MHLAPTIVLTENERMQLERLSNSRTTQVRLAVRARIVLHAADGLLNGEIAKRVGVTPSGYRLLKRVLQEALTRGADERAAYLDETCAGDPGLRRDV